ncbi:MAG: TolC family protein, partial [Acidobacteriota bacterium]
MRFAIALAVSLTGASPPAPLQPPLTLHDAVVQARTSSPLLGSARSLAEGATEAARVVSRLLNPTFDFRIENLGSGAPSGVLPPDVFAEASLPIEMGGRRGRRAAIAAADRDVATGHLQAMSFELSVRTVRAYLQALKARALVETLAANRDGLASLIETMARRVTEGVAAESDLLRFQMESARMDIDVAKAGLELERSLTQLAFVIGAPEAIAAGQLVEPPPVTPPAHDAAALAQAVARHPDVTTAASRVTKAQQIAALERS